MPSQLWTYESLAQAAATISKQFCAQGQPPILSSSTATSTAAGIMSG